MPRITGVEEMKTCNIGVKTQIQFPEAIYRTDVISSDLYNSTLSSTISRRRIEELLDERKRLLTVLVDVLLVRVGVVAVAAVRIRRIAVRLDDARVGRGALEAALAGGELFRQIRVSNTDRVG